MSVLAVAVLILLLLCSLAIVSNIQPARQNTDEELSVHKKSMVTVIRTGEIEELDKPYPAIYLDKLDAPDFMQTDPDLALPDGGKAFCGPVSVACSLVWLAENGFENLVDDLPGQKHKVYETALVLGSPARMYALDSGVAPDKLIMAVYSYVQERGYGISRLEYQGWRYHAEYYTSGTKIPDPDWIKEGVIGNSAVWLLVGFYTYASNLDEYNNYSAHWISVVGYGVDETGRRDPSVLIVHDSSERSGVHHSNDYIRLEKIRSGRMKTTWQTTDAEGFYLLRGDIEPDNGFLCILEGAVVLKLTDPASNIAHH